MKTACNSGVGSQRNRLDPSSPGPLGEVAGGAGEGLLEYSRIGSLQVMEIAGGSG